MTRPTAGFRIWVLGGALWAPLVWIVPLVLFDFRDTVRSLEYFPYTVLIPLALLWVAAVVVNWSLWTATRRVDVLAIPFGLLSIGLPVVVIGALSLWAANCGSSDFLCPNARGERRAAMLTVGAGMVLLSLPAWITAGIVDLVAFIRR